MSFHHPRNMRVGTLLVRWLERGRNSTCFNSKVSLHPSPKASAVHRMAMAQDSDGGDPVIIEVQRRAKMRLGAQCVHAGQ